MGTGNMKLARPERCKNGHAFYRESGTTSGCPYCLFAQLTHTTHELERIKGVLQELSAS